MSSMAIAGQALEILKQLRELDADLKNAEVKLQLADLYGKVAELRIALADAELSLREKDEIIATLKQRADSRIPTLRHNGFNFGIDSAGKPLTKPFCPKCEQKEGLQIMLQYRVGGTVVCPGCEGIYDNRMTAPPATNATS